MTIIECINKFRTVYILGGNNMIKKITVYLIAFVLFLCLNIDIFTHPASAIYVKQDKVKGILMIQITHPVRNVTRHYISKVVIKINGKIVKILSPAKQTNKTSEIINVKVGNYKKGSRIDVIATCNIRGTRSTTLTGM